jgi:hypothetical protein
MKFRHSVLTRTHFLVAELQTKIFSNIDWHLRERRTFAFMATEQEQFAHQRWKKKSWMTLLNISGSK